MDLIVDLVEANELDASLVGGKARALSILISEGFRVPMGLCITTDAFRRYLQETRLKEKVLLQVNRKRHDQMRWEEMWDTALRIRNMFQRTPLPPALARMLSDPIDECFRDRPVVVRSSSTIEDSRDASHAGLHESYINVKGTREILQHISLVWASLWSDASLLLGKGTGFDDHSEAMAVIIQELVEGEKSGVVFTADPSDSAHAVIESVHGLNKGLVDGDVEPDRWILHRKDGRVLQHVEAVRDKAVFLHAGAKGTFLSGNPASTSPLKETDVSRIWETARDIEELFGEPQDVEWTMRDGELSVLQSRPITTLEKEPERGSKEWNLKLKGSFGHLQELRERIETVHFPQMAEDAGKLAAMDLETMDDHELASEILRREKIYAYWTDIYWTEFIPMAHGVRLFGQIYNDVMDPEDPFQFAELLRQTPMLSTRRNEALQDLARIISEDPGLMARLREGDVPDRPEIFKTKLEKFLDEYGDLTWSKSRLSENLEALLKFLVNMAMAPPPEPEMPSTVSDPETLARQFIAAYSDGPEEEAERVLDLGRASWRLRDDDNVYLGRIEGQLRASMDEGARRLSAGGEVVPGLSSPGYIADTLAGRQTEEGKEKNESAEPLVENRKARQIVGQPAGRGIARGPARIVSGFEDLAGFKHGEVLVCDAIDPNMTLLVPLACAIVERRGGMLIHGAIIAREAGIPCVNGVPDATTLIRTGDNVTVDGHLGLVILHRKESDAF